MDEGLHEMWRECNREDLFIEDFVESLQVVFFKDKFYETNWCNEEGEETMYKWPVIKKVVHFFCHALLSYSLSLVKLASRILEATTDLENLLWLHFAAFCKLTLQA